MRLPRVEIIEFTRRVTDDLKTISEVMNSEIVKEAHPRLHKENVFNRRFSVALSSFGDFKVIAERLHRNIEEMIQDEKIGGNKHHLVSENQTDLKSLYVNAKIFSDDFATLLIFVFNLRGIGDRSITRLFSGLNNYQGDDQNIISFRERHLRPIKAIDTFVTQYRDDEIVHNQKKHKQTIWFVNGMDGNIQFIGGGRPSITPQEVAFLISEFVESARDHVMEDFGFEFDEK